MKMERGILGRSSGDLGVEDTQFQPVASNVPTYLHTGKHAYTPQALKSKFIVSYFLVTH